jgi:hypothetical protein
VDNIKVDLEEAQWGGMDWTGLVQFRIGIRRDSFQSGNELSGSINC